MCSAAPFPKFDIIFIQQSSVFQKEIQILLLVPTGVKDSLVVTIERNHLFADHVTSTQSPPRLHFHLWTLISVVQKQGLSGDSGHADEREAPIWQCRQHTDPIVNDFQG